MMDVSGRVWGKMKAAVFTLLSLLLLLCPNALMAQQINTDSISGSVKDTATIAARDTATKKGAALGIKISPDAPEHEVISSARDSAILDMETSIYYLYGDAQMQQEELELKSGVVEFNQKTNVISAYPEYDTNSRKISEQSFKQGSETFTYDSLRYNFKSKRAIVRNARMQYGEAYINSYQVKRNPDQSIFGYKNVYTTCNLEHPHFGINARKIKVIPNKVAASGRAHLEIADLPTPLLFPFGIFPINPEKKSGFILPTYTLAGSRGVGLQRMGYYVDINKYIGASIMFDYFSKGGFGVFGSTEYSKRYKYNGALNIDYTYTRTGESFDATASSTKDFKVRWKHTVDQRAMPGATFTANVEFGTGGYNLVNGMTADMQLNNQYRSTIAYSKTWAGKPFSFTAAANHNQSTRSGEVVVTLPDISFNVAQLTPFQRKTRVGKDRWYEKISATYNFAAQNRINFIDTAFSFNNLSSKQFDNGIKHTAAIAATYNVLRFVNWNFSIPYNEYWNTKQTFYTWNQSELRNDTATKSGFFATRDFSFNSSLNTRIYGLKTFKKGNLMGIRHVITPSLNFNYTPGFARSPFNYFYEYYDSYGRPSYNSPYSASPSAIMGPTTPLPNGSAGISINNNLQIKVRSKDSTGTKNITLIDGLSIGANYNFFADSNNLTNISFSGRTSILQKFNISFGGAFDPYHWENGRRTRYYSIEKDGPVVKMRSMYASLDFDLSGESSSKESDEVEEVRANNPDVQRMLRNNGLASYYDFNIPWSLRISSSISYSANNQIDGSEKEFYTPQLSVSGSLRFTKKMMFNFVTGYDFRNKSIGATTLNISRDLHCWQMALNITPFGIYRNYNFTLNVKSSVLQDLKLTRRRAYQDNF